MNKDQQNVIDNQEDLTEVLRVRSSSSKWCCNIQNIRNK